MNPLSPFGRGVKTQQLAYTNNEMCLLKKQTELLATDNFQIVYIRFPNNEQKPIGKCPIGSVATVYKGNIIKNLIMDCQSYTKYRPNETTGGIFVSWRRKEELPTGA